MASTRLPDHFKHELSNHTFKDVAIYSDADEIIDGHAVKDILVDMASNPVIRSQHKFQVGLILSEHVMISELILCPKGLL